MAPAFYIRWAVGSLLWTAAVVVWMTPRVAGNDSQQGAEPFRGTGDGWSMAEVRKLALHKDMAEVVLNLKSATRTVRENNTLT